MQKVGRKKPATPATEDEERDFWARTDSSDVVDWKQAVRAVFPNLRPSVKTISLRLPEWMIVELKALANKRDIPYQSLLKLFLAERLEKELRLRLPVPAKG